MRLLYTRELSLGADRNACHRLLAAAEDAVYDAYAAVEATGKSVKVEIDILEGCAIPVLIDATESTRLLSIGNAESGNACSNGFGSTAAKLVQSAHCSVAVVRGERDADLTDNRSIVALVEGTAGDDAAVEWGFEEATRRKAPLVLMTAYLSITMSRREGRTIPRCSYAPSRHSASSSPTSPTTPRPRNSRQLARTTPARSANLLAPSEPMQCTAPTSLCLSRASLDWLCRFGDPVDV